MSNMPNTFYNDFDCETLGGTRGQKSQDKRSPFQVDRDRIVFTSAFRRLQSKTQVFQSGQHDFYRTRLTHSLEVARIGRSICEQLRSDSSSILSEDFFIDPDLVEVIGLAHDIGHPPFGHIGERKLNDLMQTFGGFESNAQTLRLITELIYDERSDKPEGLQPTRAFLDGVLKYKALHGECIEKTGDAITYPDNHFLYDEQAKYREWVLSQQASSRPDKPSELNQHKSIECQIMDWADDTAYSLHDIVDGSKAGFLTRDRIERWAEGKQLDEDEQRLLNKLLTYMQEQRLERSFSAKIGVFIHACSLKKHDGILASETNRYRYRLEIDPAVKCESKLYKRIALDLIFRSTPIQQIEFKGGFLLQRLWDALADCYLGRKIPGLSILPDSLSQLIEQNANDTRQQARYICDYLASLTDGEALRLYQRLYGASESPLAELI